jgi:hypothetical protein
MCGSGARRASMSWSCQVASSVTSARSLRSCIYDTSQWNPAGQRTASGTASPGTASRAGRGGQRNGQPASAIDRRPAPHGIAPWRRPGGAVARQNPVAHQKHKPSLKRLLACSGRVCRLRVRAPNITPGLSVSHPVRVLLRPRTLPGGRRRPDRRLRRGWPSQGRAGLPVFRFPAMFLPARADNARLRSI